MNKEGTLQPIVNISLDCVPKDEIKLKNNLKQFYDVCNEVIDNPNCFYTDEEIDELKKNKEIQKQLNIKFI